MIAEAEAIVGAEIAKTQAEVAVQTARINHFTPSTATANKSVETTAITPHQGSGKSGTEKSH
jgi:hypothetical protein